MNVAPTDEIFVLILRLLESDPRLASSFSALRSDVEAAGLLGPSLAWTGNRRPATYDQAVRRLGAPPNPLQLQRLLSRLSIFLARGSRRRLICPPHHGACCAVARSPLRPISTILTLEPPHAEKESEWIEKDVPKSRSTWAIPSDA